MYEQYWHLEADWSSSGSYAHESLEYPLVDYSDYAKSFQIFRERFPYFTVEVFTQADAMETLGRAGHGHETLRYDTLVFKDSNYHSEYALDSRDDQAVWETKADFGIRFRTEDRTLYLQCFIDAFVWSFGYYTRSLNIGYSVCSITFHAKNGTNIKSLINPSDE